MNRILKISLATVLCLAVLLAVGITLTIGWRPILGPRSRPLTNRVFERTPERWARGKYIVESEAACVDCHSPHDWSKHDAPILPGMEGAGRDFADIERLARHGRGAQSYARFRNRLGNVERRCPGPSDSRRNRP